MILERTEPPRAGCDQGAGNGAGVRVLMPVGAGPEVVGTCLQHGGRWSPESAKAVAARPPETARAPSTMTPVAQTLRLLIGVSPLPKSGSWNFCGSVVVTGASRPKPKPPRLPGDVGPPAQETSQEPEANSTRWTRTAGGPVTRCHTTPRCGDGPAQARVVAVDLIGESPPRGGPRCPRG
jgi:hypothetical protein